MATPAWPQDEPASSEVPAPPSDAAPAQTSAASGPGMRWGVPPVQWSGSLAYGLRIDRVGDSSRETENQVTATLNAYTYIYQPWLALVNASLSVTRTHTVLSDAPTLHDDFATGALRLGMFSRSRFPLDMRYEVTDSRTDSSLAGGVDYRSHLFAVTQNYRPASGDFNISGTYERRMQDGPTFGKDSQESLLADFGLRWKRHALAATLARSFNQRGSTGEEADFRSAVLRDSYGSGSDFTVETTINWAQSDDRLLVSPIVQKLGQFSSIGLYRPEGTGLTVSGSLRGFTLEIEGQEPTASVDLTLGAAYEFNRNLRLNANASITRTNGTTAESWVGLFGGTYQGDTQRFSDWLYDWQTGAALSRARTIGLEDTTLSTQAGHTLSRSWPSGPSSNWTFNLSQTFGVAYTWGDFDTPEHPLGLSRTLAQTAGLTWLSSGPNRNAYARLSVSDARELDGEEAQFQLINAQLSGTYEIDRFRGWTGDLSLQRVFQSSVVFQGPSAADPFGLNRTITNTASGEVSWRQARVFEVPRLRFTSRLRLSRDMLYQRDALVALPDRDGISWENRFDYLIGQLEASALLRLAKFEGLRRDTLQLRLQRNF